MLAMFAAFFGGVVGFGLCALWWATAVLFGWSPPTEMQWIALSAIGVVLSQPAWMLLVWYDDC